MPCSPFSSVFIEIKGICVCVWSCLSPSRFTFHDFRGNITCTRYTVCLIARARKHVQPILKFEQSEEIIFDTAWYKQMLKAPAFPPQPTSGVQPVAPRPWHIQWPTVFLTRNQKILQLVAGHGCWNKRINSVLNPLSTPYGREPNKVPILTSMSKAPWKLEQTKLVQSHVQWFQKPHRGNNSAVQ